MNLPNKLTVLRMAMVPFFVGALLWRGLPHRYLVALLLFVAASIQIIWMEKLLEAAI